MFRSNSLSNARPPSKHERARTTPLSKRCVPLIFLDDLLTAVGQSVLIGANPQTRGSDTG